MSNASGDPGGGPKRASPSQPGKLPPELREWALQRFTEEEAVASLRELREKGGFELWEFIQELEQGLHDGEPTSGQR